MASLLPFLSVTDGNLSLPFLSVTDGNLPQVVPSI